MLAPFATLGVLAFTLDTKTFLNEEQTAEARPRPISHHLASSRLSSPGARPELARSSPELALSSL